MEFGGDGEMKKWFVVVALAVVLSGCSLLPQKTQPAGESAGGQEEISSSDEAFTGKLKAAVALGVPMKCSYKIDNDSYGTGYVKGRKYYGEMTNDGEEGRIIMVDECMWTWRPGDAQGVKMCFTPTEGEESIWDMETEDAPTAQGVSNVDYSCVPAIVADSKFNPPADISFMNVDQMMQGEMMDYNQ
jgi:hypothetical protein